MNGTTRMRKRQQLLRRYCEHVYQSDVIDPAGESLFRTTSLVSERLNLLYCPVGKIASTLLTRFLVAAGETHPVISPYAMSPQKALRVRFKNTGLNILFSRLSKLVHARGRGKDEQAFMGKLTRMLFVRCPFRRLWSAYVDKLLFPNPHYWQAWGLPALNTPNSQDGEDLQCGENVTFPQFIDFVLDRLHQFDTHVRPVSWECAPCYVDYDVIGRVETLTSDVMHLAGLLRLDMDRNLRGLDWEEEHAKDVIKEAVKNVFSKWTSEIRVCTSMDTAAQRLWRVLQIQGIISQKAAYPFTQTEGQVLSLDASQMINTLLDAHEKSGARELEQQKNGAFLGAYKMVSTRQKDEIRRVYKADFEMFGYDPYYLWGHATLLSQVILPLVPMSEIKNTWLSILLAYPKWLFLAFPPYWDGQREYFDNFFVVY